MNRPDCIVVGFNEVDFDGFARAQKKFADVSGSYSELKTNSVLIGERRHTYMDLLNIVLGQATDSTWNLNAFALPSLGVVYLISFLRRRGFDVNFVNFFNWEKNRLAQLLQDSPRVVAITTTYYVDDQPIKEIVDFVREHNPTVKIAIGGPRILAICSAHNQHMQNLIFRMLGGDIYICDSQGESTLAQVLDCLRDGTMADLARIPNLIYRVDVKAFMRTGRQPEHNDLDQDAVDWRYFDSAFYAPTVYMRTARSCAFRCAFCNYPAMAGPLTLSSLQTLEQEMQYLAAAGVKNIIFVDDTFNVPLPRFKKLCRMMIQNNFRFQWISFLRCSNTDEETFDLIAESGCIGVFLGIESGDDQILKAMNKYATLDRYRHGIKQLSERGILTLASLIVGYPGETEQTIHNTLEFLNSNPTTFYNVQLYYHDTLAPIESQREELGIQQSGYAWCHQTMDWHEAVGWKEHMIGNITGPALLPLYGLSIWALPYLLDQGLTVEQIIKFAKDANRLLIKGLDDTPLDCSADLEKMRLCFRGLPGPNHGRCDLPIQEAETR